MTSSRAYSGLANALSGRPRSNKASAELHQVVVIDDDAASRDSLAFILGDEYQVTTCSSAKSGMVAINDDVCAVILDVRMPEQDGFSACAEIRQRFPDLPIIFYSAHQNLKDPYDIINEYHPFGYVAKGDDLQKLVSLISMAVKVHSIVVHNRKLISRLQKRRNTER